ISTTTSRPASATGACRHTSASSGAASPAALPSATARITTMSVDVPAFRRICRMVSRRSSASVWSMGVPRRIGGSPAKGQGSVPSVYWRWRLMQNATISIRPADDHDAAALWRILEPVIREGATYALPSDMSEPEGLRYWREPTHEVFVAESDGEIVGTYFLRPNQSGGGSHVANCGYMTAPWAAGRGVARAMCAHSLEHAKT